MAKPSSGHLRALALRAQKLGEAQLSLAADLNDSANRAEEWERNRERRMEERRTAIAGGEGVAP